MTVDRNGLQMLSSRECLAHLSAGETTVGRLGMLAAGRPLILPVNFAVHDAALAFRVGDGTMLHEAVQRADVAFEVDVIDPTWRTGWSVVVHGTAAEVLDPVEIDELRDLLPRSWAAGTKEHFVKVTIARVSGRRIARGAEPAAR